MEDKILLNLTQAAKQLSVSMPTIRKWIREEELPVLRVGGCVRIPKKQLEEWVSERTKN